VKQTIKAGTLASFEISDVVCPEAGQVIRQIGPGLKVVGEVVYLSDSGDQKDHFAVIDVEGIHAPLIVRVDRLRTVGLEAHRPQYTERVQGAVGESRLQVNTPAVFRSHPCNAGNEPAS
jgi:hypothetical protein